MPKGESVSLNDIWERLGELTSNSHHFGSGIKELRSDFSTFQEQVNKQLDEFGHKLEERNGARYLVRLGVVAAVAAIGGERALELIAKLAGSLF